MNNGPTNTHFVLTVYQFCQARWKNIGFSFKVTVDGEKVLLAESFANYRAGDVVGKLGPKGVTLCGRDRFSQCYQASLAAA